MISLKHRERRGGVVIIPLQISQELVVSVKDQGITYLGEVLDNIPRSWEGQDFSQLLRKTESPG